MSAEKQSTVSIDINGKSHRFIIWAGMRLSQFIDLNGYQPKEVYLKAVDAFAKMIAANPVETIGKERTAFKDGSFVRLQSVTYRTGLATKAQAEKHIEDSRAKSDKAMTKLFNAFNAMPEDTKAISATIGQPAPTPVNA